MEVLGAFGVRSDHVAHSLCDGPTILSARTMKAAVRPCLVSIKRKHSLHVLKHIIKRTTTERALKVSPVPAPHLLMMLKVALEMSFIVKVRIVSKDVKVFEDIVEIKVEILIVASSRALRPHLIILLPSLVI